MENADLLKPWQLAREQYKQRKRLVGDREKATLARLKHFSQTLRTSSSVMAAPAGKETIAAVRGPPRIVASLTAAGAKEA